MSFFANIIHDSRRTFRSSESRSDKLGSVKAKPDVLGSRGLDDNVPSAPVFNETTENKLDEVNSETAKETADMSIEPTKHSAELSNHQAFEKDRSNLNSSSLNNITTSITTGLNSNSKKSLTKQLDADSETAIVQVNSNLAANCEPLIDEKATAKQHYAKSLTKSVATSIPPPLSNTVAQAEKLIPEGNESRVKSSPLSASSVEKPIPLGQPTEVAEVAVDKSERLTKFNQLEKQVPEKQNAAVEQLLQNALSNLNPAFIEKQTQHTSFHPDQRNKLVQHQAAPKVKIGQMNVVVETPVVKQKTAKTEVSDNTSRAFLRSL